MREKEQAPAPLAIVVEDEGAIRTLLTEVLTDEGYGVVAYAQVDPAVAALDSLQPALVMTDLGFSQLGDGWRVVWRMRSDARLKHVPLVICTATLPTPEDRAAAERLRVHWLAKPFTLDALLNSLDLARLLVAPPNNERRTP
jgi:CheY-like chemotaxis protein